MGCLQVAVMDGEVRMVWILPVLNEVVNRPFRYFRWSAGWFVSGRKIGKAGCVPVVPDVHYLGLELSAFGAFQR